MEEYDSMSIAQHKQLYHLQNKARHIKGKKIPERSRTFEARMVVLEAKTENSSNESLFTDEMPKANERNNQALDRKGGKQNQTEPYRHLTVRAIKNRQSAQCA